MKEEAYNKYNFLSWIATLAGDMEYWRYNDEARMLEKFVNTIEQHPEKMRTQSPQISQMLQRVLADAERKYANGADKLDDFDDFIDLLKYVIKIYAKEVFAARKQFPIQPNTDDMTIYEAKKRNNKVRINESQLHRIIKESVKKVLKEGENNQPITTKKTTYDVDGYSEPCFEVTDGYVMVRIAPCYRLVGANTIFVTEYIDGEFNSREEWKGDFNSLTKQQATMIAKKCSAYLSR